MIKNTVRIEHAQKEPSHMLYQKARIWINDVEIIGILDYRIEASIGEGGVYQTLTIEMLADVSIEYKPTE